MRWILFILFCLLGAPAHAVSIPGVTTTTRTDSTPEPAPEPDIEQKKAGSRALADVLDNDTSRKELIDQLRTVAATPPAEPVPKIVPPTLVATSCAPSPRRPLRNRYRRSCRRRWLKSKPCCKRSPKSAAIMVKPFPPASGNFIAISPAPRISERHHYAVHDRLGVVPDLSQ